MALDAHRTEPRKLRIGIVCPYSFETPGGVQSHVHDFAQVMRERGHDVEVLAPGRRTKDMPLWVQTNGSSFAIPYNGSWAHLSYFLIAGMQTRRWVRQGNFDIVHLHEPEAPSLAHKPVLMKDAPPLVGTFHASIEPYPRALKLFENYLRKCLVPLEKAIFVSPAAQSTAEHYLPGSIERQIIPNGIFTKPYREAKPNAAWKGNADAPTIGFLGRMGEERKGFHVYAKAANLVLASYPHARFLVAGDGEKDGRKYLEDLDPSGKLASHFEFLGRISDQEKASFYRSLDIYVAPQTGGESFGIVLAEAMAAGCPIVASDLEAFSSVTEQGTSAELFETNNPESCAHTICALLDTPARREVLSKEGKRRARDFDWSTVADQVLEVYKQVLDKHEGK